MNKKSSDRSDRDIQTLNLTKKVNWDEICWKFIKNESKKVNFNETQKKCC